jgi:hypothetical protein
MFFSLTPNAFRQPTPCALDNGTTVYFGNDDLDCSCLAPIRADPDFAGPGIITSFIFIAWLTIIISSIPTGFALLKSWQRTPGPYRFWKWFIANLQFESVEGQYRQSVIVDEERSKLPVRDSVASGNSDLSIEQRKPQDRFLPMARQPSALRTPMVREPPYCKWARRIVLQLCDIQIIAGIAVLVSALAQYERLTFYHAQFVVQFWWLTLNSFWISRIDYSRNTPEMGTWRANARRTALWISVALSIIMQSIVAYREFKEWDITIPGHCYVASGTGTGFGQNVFWLAGTGLYFLVTSIALFPSTRKWFDENINEKIVPSLNLMTQRVKDYRTTTHKFTTSESSTAASRLRYYLSLMNHLLRTVILFVALVFWWVLILFLTVWCAGNSAAFFELGLYSVFAGFLTWWIVFLKVQNKPLIRGDETRFTIGQTLPLFLLLLVAIHALDVWAGVASEEQRRARYLQNKGRAAEIHHIEEQEDVATNAAAAAMATSKLMEPVTPFLTPAVTPAVEHTSPMLQAMDEKEAFASGKSE